MIFHLTRDILLFAKDRKYHAALKSRCSGLLELILACAYRADGSFVFTMTDILNSGRHQDLVESSSWPRDIVAGIL